MYPKLKKSSGQATVLGIQNICRVVTNTQIILYCLKKGRPLEAVLPSPFMCF